MDTIYQDIAARTQGNVYIGVVGPVRTGKSTLIKRIMETMVIPNLDDPHRRERARDELPQCGSGKTIMTAEPKFVPEEAARVSPDGKTTLNLRLIDSVGYMVPGAAGAEEDGNPRMVTTPWYDHEIPLTQAAELGTKKVMDGHCSMGLVVTTDGTVTDIPREDYRDAERRAIRDMAATGKPWLLIVNSRDPAAEAARTVRRQLSEEFGVEPIVLDARTLDEEGICSLLRAVLYAFPVGQLEIHLPRWLDALESSQPVKMELYEALVQKAESIGNLGQAEPVLTSLEELEQVRSLSIRSTDLGKGTVAMEITLPDTLYYEILSSRAGIPIENEAQLLSLLTQLAAVKKEYDRISDALSSVRATGYGVVMPAAEEMTLQTPEMVKKGGVFGVKLKAGAPSIHMVRVDVDTEISPMVGDEKQSRDLIAYLTGESPEKLWESNIFGKSVYDLIREGLGAKLVGLPEDVRGKFRGTLTRIVNEGATGLVCLIL